MRLGRRPRPDIGVAAGERILAWAGLADGGWVAGSRDALYLPGARLPWELVQEADWDSANDRLVVSEIGVWGEPRPRHLLAVADADAKEADRLLQLVRERVTASVLLSRHVRVNGRRGVRIVARRAPSGRSDVEWIFEYDVGVDPDDPFVAAAAETALAAAKADIGML